jgi:hypothetical protein
MANVADLSAGVGNVSSLHTSTITNYEIYTTYVDLDNQVLTANTTNLLLNGIPIATVSQLSNVADWSLYPAISTGVNMANLPILNCSSLQLANNIVTTTTGNRLLVNGVDSSTDWSSLPALGPLLMAGQGIVGASSLQMSTSVVSAGPGNQLFNNGVDVSANWATHAAQVPIDANNKIVGNVSSVNFSLPTLSSAVLQPADSVYLNYNGLQLANVSTVANAVSTINNTGFIRNPLLADINANEFAINNCREISGGNSTLLLYSSTAIDFANTPIFNVTDVYPPTSNSPVVIHGLLSNTGTANIVGNLNVKGVYTGEFNNASGSSNFMGNPLTIGNTTPVYTGGLTVNGPVTLDGGTLHGVSMSCLPVLGVNTCRIEAGPFGVASVGVIDIVSPTAITIDAGGAANVAAGGAVSVAAGSYVVLEANSGNGANQGVFIQGPTGQSSELTFTHGGSIHNITNIYGSGTSELNVRADQGYISSLTTRYVGGLEVSVGTFIVSSISTIQFISSVIPDPPAPPIPIPSTFYSTLLSTFLLPGNLNYPYGGNLSGATNIQAMSLDVPSANISSIQPTGGVLQVQGSVNATNLQATSLSVQSANISSIQPTDGYLRVAGSVDVESNYVINMSTLDYNRGDILWDNVGVNYQTLQSYVSSFAAPAALSQSVSTLTQKTTGISYTSGLLTTNVDGILQVTGNANVIGTVNGLNMNITSNATIVGDMTTSSIHASLSTLQNPNFAVTYDSTSKLMYRSPFPATPQAFSYNIYVSNISGSDSTGTGSIIFPYKTIGAAVTYANTIADSNPVIINLACGTYTENVSITRDNTYIVGGSTSLSSATIVNGTITYDMTGTSQSIVVGGISSLQIYRFVANNASPKNQSLEITDCIIAPATAGLNCILGTDASVGGNCDITIQNSVLYVLDTVAVSLQSVSVSMINSQITINPLIVGNVNVSFVVTTGTGRFNAFGCTLTQPSTSSTVPPIIDLQNNIATPNTMVFNSAIIQYTSSTADTGTGGKACIRFSNPAGITMGVSTSSPSVSIYGCFLLAQGATTTNGNAGQFVTIQKAAGTGTAYINYGTNNMCGATANHISQNLTRTAWVALSA